MSDMPDETENRPQETPTPSSAPGTRRKRWVPMALLCVVAILAVVGYRMGWPAALLGGDDTPEVPPGSPPAIVGLTVGTERILPLSSAALICEAVDPDGDELMFTWSVTGGEVVGDGAEIEWRAPDAEGLYKAFVIVEDGFHPAVEGSVSLTVRANQPPEILYMRSELSEEDGWVVPGAGVYVSCDAEDPDGDTLTYQWSSTDGELFGQGAAVVWVAPQSLGMKWVTVTATDVYGGVASRSLPITVSAAEPPVIHDVKVKALDTDLFKPYGDSWRIFKERSCSLEAVVDDPEGVYTYEWSAEKGTLTADGARATWTAPASPKGWVNIVLRVTDRHGNESNRSVRIYVETCTSCM